MKSLKNIPELFCFFHAVPWKELEFGFIQASLRRRMPTHLADRSYDFLEHVLEWPGAMSNKFSIYGELGDTTKERLLNALILADADLLDKFAVWEYAWRTNGK